MEEVLKVSLKKSSNCKEANVRKRNSVNNSNKSLIFVIWRIFWWQSHSLNQVQGNKKSWRPNCQMSPYQGRQIFITMDLSRNQNGNGFKSIIAKILILPAYGMILRLENSFFWFPQKCFRNFKRLNWTTEIFVLKTHLLTAAAHSQMLQRYQTSKGQTSKNHQKVTKKSKSLLKTTGCVKHIIHFWFI